MKSYLPIIALITLSHPDERVIESLIECWIIEISKVIHLIAQENEDSWKSVVLHYDHVCICVYSVFKCLCLTVFMCVYACSICLCVFLFFGYIKNPNFLFISLNFWHYMNSLKISITFPSYRNLLCFIKTTLSIDTANNSILCILTAHRKHIEYTHTWSLIHIPSTS